ncbi:Transcription factor SPATULA [Vitis vinifera]|uniref:Transcription factor SPATULA n=1 Tax=Vitis vinifera TaxID=29760 RepID=A0A438KJ69_VITVI|nr:Transcription factor SPATULA [Vitis vinifera]
MAWINWATLFVLPLLGWGWTIMDELGQGWDFFVLLLNLVRVDMGQGSDNHCKPEVMLDHATLNFFSSFSLKDQTHMLSMRNGLSLHPMCLPGVLPPVQLSQMRIGIGEENGSLHMDMTGTLPVNQETMEYRLANQGTSSSHPSVPNLTDIMNSETSFGLESSIQAHLGPFQLQTSSADICREDVLPHQQLNISCAGTNSLVSLPYDAQASGVKDSNTLESCIQRRDLSEGMLLKNIEHNQVPFPQLNGMHTGRSVPNDDMKTDRLDF